MIRLKTRYSIGEIPHEEHPCPQAKRKDWLCLNGKWDLEKVDSCGNKVYRGCITVPFSPESLLSGVEEGFVLAVGETLIYRRNFLVSENLLRGKTILHFGAVDSECEVFLNGQKVGGHVGGFTAFSLDVSEELRLGENQIEVICRDEATRNSGARGKQSDKPGKIWYTAQSGIWQTVWLESMPTKPIGSFRITPNFENNSVTLSCLGESAVTVTVFDEDKEILTKSGRESITLFYNFEPWSPENPKLYPFILENEDGDKVESYFAFRSFGQGKDKNGITRLLLNGKPYFFNGVLDQGYWSDGMLTYPSDKAVEDELTMLKNMGFNCVRKHIKIEPMRWYYHCDRLGLVVWQDFVNGGGAYNPFHIAIFPFLGIKHKDNDYAYFARQDKRGREEFIQSVKETISGLYNCPCIGLWTPFNEGWGQFDSYEVTKLVKELDNTRMIDSVSGWHDQGVEKTTMKSLHTYFTPLKVPKDARVVVLSEFGGYSMKVDGHVFNPSKAFGYKKFRNQERLLLALKKLYLKKLMPLLKKGLCACIYTQVSDVEEEINGLTTYDRQIIKIPVEEMAKINTALAKEWASIL